MRMIDESPDAAGASCPPPQQRVRSTLCRYSLPLAVAMMLVLGMVALMDAQGASQAGAESAISAESAPAPDPGQPIP